MIIATAGHVDHGKTTLVRALTGVDTDRLKEEKSRGMSIEAGFAYADFGNGFPIGFVDVPGHERFVRNMLAGVAAVDFALLVVAVDDGPMPQTVEHLAILELLGIRQGAVVLSKIDRVAPARVAQVQGEVRALLAASALHDAPMFEVAAAIGAGVAALRKHLATVARAMPRRTVHGNFRLAVDRCFSLTGTGLVVTGAVFSGSARIGDQLLVSPQGIPVRLRGIRLHNRDAEVAEAGWRCALNLAGSDLKRISIERGDWIVAEAAHAPSERVDVRINVLGSQTKLLADGAMVHLHAGAAAVNARVTVLEGRSIAAGCSAFAQLVTDRPLCVVRGDRLILREQSAQHTIAGGIVLDPFGLVRGRAKPARRAQLVAMDLPTPEQALQALLDLPGDGVPIDSFARAWNLTPEEKGALSRHAAITFFIARGETRGIATSCWQAMRDRLLDCLRDCHAAQPEALGPSEAMLATALGMPVLSPAWSAALKSLCDDGMVLRDGISLRLPQYVPQLSDADASLLRRVTEVLRAAGLRPPVIGELAKTLEMELPLLLEFAERAGRLGHLVRVAKNRFFLPESISALAAIAAQLAQESEPQVFDAASYRDRSGIGRNLTIELLEFMDRTRITRYAGGKRRIM